LRATTLTIVNEPATVTAESIPMKMPNVDVFSCLISPNGFEIKMTPIIHDNIFTTSNLDSFSPIARYVNIDTNIGEVKVKVVANDIGFTCNVKKANRAEVAAKNIRSRIAFLPSGSIPTKSTLQSFHIINVIIKSNIPLT